MLKQRVRRSFNRAAPTYDAAADMQRRIAAALAARLPPETDARTIVDAGAGTGHALAMLTRRWPQSRLIAVDLADAMLRRLPAEAKVATPLCADLEHLPLATACADLYWASLSLQWCQLPAALGEARRILRPGGTLAFSTLTGDSFHELRSAFAGIDGHAHTLDFLSPEQIADSVAAAGFTQVAVSRDRLTARFADLKALLRSVKAVGASEVSGGTRRGGMLGKNAWLTVEAQYARHRRDGHCPLTYDALYVVARA